VDTTEKRFANARDGYIGSAGHFAEETDMADGFVHTVHADGSWRNSVENAAPLPGTYDTKAEAVEAGRAEARRRKTEHLIHNEDGSISERNSYGGDPAHRPG
jgi:hypothetical protein